MKLTDAQLTKKLREIKVIPVIALDNAEDILPLADILNRHHLPVAEITLRSEQAIKAIQLLHQTQPEILIGAGTVLTKSQIEEAKMAGASFIVTPGFNPNIIQHCQKFDIPIIPGVNNPMAIEQALEFGITTVKFFPAEPSGGINMIKSLVGPYAQLQFMPTGGINLNNLQDYLSIKQVVACGGSWFVEKALINGHHWDEIEKRVIQLKEFLSKIESLK